MCFCLLPRGLQLPNEDATALERDYNFHNTDVRHPNQRPFLEIMRHWVPSAAG